MSCCKKKKKKSIRDATDADFLAQETTCTVTASRQNTETRKELLLLHVSMSACVCMSHQGALMSKTTQDPPQTVPKYQNNTTARSA